MSPIMLSDFFQLFLRLFEFIFNKYQIFRLFSPIYVDNHVDNLWLDNNKPHIAIGYL